MLIYVTFFIGSMFNTNKFLCFGGNAKLELAINARLDFNS